ncbi:MAG: hypothetical protein ABS949_03265 [Solibacillus sp.]
MALTKQQALQALNNKQFIGFTTQTGNVLIKKANRTDYNIYVYEQGNETPAHYIGSVANVLKTLNDKSGNQDFVIVEE